jgi:MFS family permease
VLGGLIVDHASYHWIFWLGAIMAVVATVATELFIPESPVRTPGRVDVAGAVLLGIGIVLPLLAITYANDWGWASPRTLGLAAAGAAALVAWVALELRTAQPLANVRSLARPVVATTNVASLLVGFGMFGSFILTPNLLQAPERLGYGFGYSATGAGLVMLPGALLMIGVGPLSGTLATRFGPKVPMALGGMIAGLGLLALAEGHSTVPEIVLFSAVLSAGIALAFAAMPNLIVSAVPAEETGEATGFNTLMRSVGASLGTQVTAAVLASETLAGTPIPTAGAYTTAFLVGAGAAFAAGLVALAIPTSGQAHGTEALAFNRA